MIQEVKENEVYFAKIKENAIIPSKRDEDAGYDIYACFNEDYVVIEPNTTKLIPTGIASAFSSNYVVVLKERGSTGTKGIAQRCGVIDSGFRNEWLVPITNVNNMPIVITKNIKRNFDFECIKYPYEKAICQALILPVPKINIKEISYEELKAISSQRGMGMLGSSNK